jgi:hypothetical protein
MNQFKPYDKVAHTDKKGKRIVSWFFKYCSDPSKALVMDDEKWDTGYEVVRVSELEHAGESEELS